MKRMKGIDAFDNNMEINPIYPEPTNEFDGHIYHDDGSKSFVDGAGKVGGVNARV